MALNSLLSYLTSTLTPSNRQWLAKHLLDVDSTTPYTIEELRARAEQSVQQIAEGKCYSAEEADAFMSQYVESRTRSVA